MIIQFVTADNAITLPQPIPDESEQHYHLEERLQVAVRAPDNDKQYTIEFRLDEGSDAPTQAQCDAWVESGELLRVVCSGVSARAFAHKEGKQYRSRGSEKEINGQTVTLDTMLIFAGQSITPASDPFDIDEELRKARGSYKKSQRAFRQRVNADRVAKAQAGIEERVAKMREAAQAKEAAAAAAAAGSPDAATGTGRRRS